jgi:signal transduction histidine kinase
MQMAAQAVEAQTAATDFVNDLRTNRVDEAYARTTRGYQARQTLELLQPELDNRGITIKSKLARHLPVTPIDPTQTQQALVNLAKNAMQAMTTGGTLRLNGETPKPSEERDDTGGGIPQEQINRIFEPFFTTKKTGTGLGLMIVQRIVRTHGGRIELESHVGRGTTFRLWLPLHEKKPRLLEAPGHD